MKQTHMSGDISNDIREILKQGKQSKRLWQRQGGIIEMHKVRKAKTYCLLYSDELKPKCWSDRKKDKQNQGFHIFTRMMNKTRWKITKLRVTPVSRSSKKPEIVNSFLRTRSEEPMNIKEMVYLLRKEQFFIFHLTPSLSVGPNKIQ